MENRKEEFQKIICQIYMVVVLAVLPLYYIPGNGYYKLGDTKYFLYRNISMVCMGICLVAGLITVIGSCRVEKHGSFGMLLQESGKRLCRWCREHAAVTAVCLYGVVAVISAFCSPYGKTAWMGEREWYMGAVTICLMVGGFLLAAKYAKECKTVLLLGEAAFTVVTLIGLFQKLGYDPLGLLKGYVVGDWEYTHMLTTLGNCNWLSGYYSVMFPFSLALFQQAVREERRIRKFVLGVCNVFAVMLLLLQGSDGGVLVAGMGVWLCFWWNRKNPAGWRELLFLMTAVCAGMMLWGKWMQSLGTYDILLQDGISKTLAGWKGWFPAAVVCLLFCGIYYVLPKEKMKLLQAGLLCGSLAVAVAVLLWYIHKLTGMDFAEWGNRRGKLWQMAWKGFCEGDLRQKLLGAGPDCFASYLGELLPGGTVLFDKGYFNGSVFTNAHNEWFTVLVNMGLLGVAAYAAVFIAAFRKYGREPLGFLLLFTYGIHSLISFQQVLNAPFFFLMLGVCEASAAGKRMYKIDTDEESTGIR